MVEVLKAGFYDSIQDLGRVGFQQYGVPYSGVMDHYAASLANILLGNDINEAVIEITMTGPKLKFHCNTAICISGANFIPLLNESAIENNKVIQINKNDILSFSKQDYGFRSYLAVLGGFQSEKIFGSRSMYQSITKAFKIAKNDLLPILGNTIKLNEKHASIKSNSFYMHSKTINVFKGPEFDMLSENQKKKLFSQDYTISKNNNRMAYQLEESLENNLKPIITSLVFPGTVQLTPSGKLIVLMRDCQTTGGYPRIFQLEEKALDVMAQKFSGQQIRFQMVS